MKINAMLHRAQRKAITPIIATILIIAVTLIAAVAITGFVFGIFGSASSTAQVEVASISLSAGGLSASGNCLAVTGKGCQVSLTNVGTANTYVAGSGMLTYGGTTVPIMVGTGAVACSTSPSTCPTDVGSPATYYVYVGAALSPTPASGEEFVGTLFTGSGAQLQFAGAFAA